MDGAGLDAVGSGAPLPLVMLDSNAKSAACQTGSRLQNIEVDAGTKDFGGERGASSVAICDIAPPSKASSFGVPTGLPSTAKPGAYSKQFV